MELKMIGTLCPICKKILLVPIGPINAKIKCCNKVIYEFICKGCDLIVMDSSNREFVPPCGDVEQCPGPYIGV